MKKLNFKTFFLVFIIVMMLGATLLTGCSITNRYNNQLQHSYSTSTSTSTAPRQRHR